MRTLLALLFVVAIGAIGCGGDETADKPEDWRDEIPEDAKLVYDFDRDGPIEQFVTGPNGEVTLPDGTKAKIKISGKPIEKQ